MSEPAHSPLIVGWREYVALPEWGIATLRAKIDTGARTSALHVENIRRLDDRHVRFDVVLNRKTGRTVPAEAPIVREAHVRSSSGQLQTRFVVETLVRLGPVSKQIELTLVSRRAMLCRMLLGRRALAEDFLVDVTRRYALGRLKDRQP